jgi:hypothetical protein
MGSDTTLRCARRIAKTAASRISILTSYRTGGLTAARGQETASAIGIVVLRMDTDPEVA